MTSNIGNSGSTSIGPGEGYKRLIVWQNAEKLRRMVYIITTRFGYIEIRRVTQLRDAVRSVKQNIQEGYKSGFLGKYIHHLTISQGSLGEAKGDIDDSFQDELITEDEYRQLDKLCGTTDFLINKMIKSMRQAEKDGTWKDFNA